MSDERSAFQAEFDKLGYRWSASNQEKAFLGWQLARAAIQRTEQREPDREQVDALLDGFDSLIATAEANGDDYAVGYVRAMKAAFEKLVGITKKEG